MSRISTRNSTSSRHSLALASALAFGVSLSAMSTAQAQGQFAAPQQPQAVSSMPQEYQLQILAAYGDCIQRNPALWNATYDDLVRACTPAPVAQPAYVPPPVQQAAYAPAPRWTNPGYGYNRGHSGYGGYYGGHGTGPISSNVPTTGGMGPGGGVIIPGPAPKPGPVVTHPCQIPPCPTSPAPTNGTNGQPPNKPGPVTTGQLPNTGPFVPGTGQLPPTKPGPSIPGTIPSSNPGTVKLNLPFGQTKSIPLPSVPGPGPVATNKPIPGTIPPFKQTKLNLPFGQNAQLARPFVQQTINRPQMTLQRPVTTFQRPVTTFQRPVTTFQRPVTTFNRPMLAPRPVLSRPVAPMRVANGGVQRRR